MPLGRPGGNPHNRANLNNLGLKRRASCLEAPFLIVAALPTNWYLLVKRTRQYVFTAMSR